MKDIEIPIGNVTLLGILTIPKNAKGIVLFAHGSGSSRLSPRNQYVAKELQKNGLATLLMDLLTEDEERVDMVTAQLRFDIELLTDRLISTTEWVKKNPTCKNLKIGYFGSSTGAGAALIAGAKNPKEIYAVVSRGGRPDLAMDYLPKVKAPTLLIVGGDDTPVIELNERALKKLKAEKRLEIVAGATHLFEEHGKLEEVARLAGEWFMRYLNSTKNLKK